MNAPNASTDDIQDAIKALRGKSESAHDETEFKKVSLPSRSVVSNAIRRKSFKHYVANHMPNYKMGWVHETICDKLQKFVQDCKDGKRPRLIVSMPPRHGKSVIVSTCLPAWVLGNDPSTELIVSSYSADLSTKFSTEAQDLCASDYHSAVFPEFEFGNTQQKASWTTKQKGGYKATGVDGSLSGHGADLFVIDDPVKNWQEAISKTYREKVWNWFASTAYTRLSPNSGILLIMTRWHDEDLAGHLLAQDDENKWDVLEFPAIATKDEPKRKFGEALHPDRFDLDALTDIKKTVGDRAWASLFQQCPRIEGGSHINREWFNVIERNEVPHGLQWRRFWDLAIKAKASNDYTASARCAMDKAGNLYIYNVMRFKKEWPFTKKMIVQTGKVEKIMVGIEAVSAFEIAVQEVRPLLKGIAKVRGYQVTTDKLGRALPWIDLAESGKVFLVNGPWVEDFLDECERFDPIKDSDHDDQVDAVSGAYQMVKRASNRPRVL